MNQNEPKRISRLKKQNRHDIKKRKEKSQCALRIEQFHGEYEENREGKGEIKTRDQRGASNGRELFGQLGNPIKRNSSSETFRVPTPPDRR